jgi:DNA-binding beta-propeller fold protein YncE
MKGMGMTRSLAGLAAALAVCVGAACGGSAAQTATAWEVDRLWPKPLPAGWILGSVTGVDVDSRDHIWVVHRGAPSMTARTEIGLATDPPTSETCCRPAPAVLEFDGTGNLVSNWDATGQGYTWPQSPGALAVDADGNVWITAAATAIGQPAGRGGRGGRGGGRGGDAPPPPPGDAHVLKFSRTGEFLMQIGGPGKVGTAESRDALNKPAGIDVAGGEVFVADTGSARVVVFDSATGAYRRHWTANGEPFQSVSCVAASADDMVYVCDRTANRIQVFQTDGTFVKEARVAGDTMGNGAVWDIAFSSDSGQSRLFVADGQNQKVWVLDRATLEQVGSVGAGGRWPGHFFAVGSVAVDSQGNLYTGETLEGKRIQKFVGQR